MRVDSSTPSAPDPSSDTHSLSKLLQPFQVKASPNSIPPPILVITHPFQTLYGCNFDVTAQPGVNPLHLQALESHTYEAKLQCQSRQEALQALRHQFQSLTNLQQDLATDSETPSPSPTLSWRRVARLDQATGELKLLHPISFQALETIMYSNNSAILTYPSLLFAGQIVSLVETEDENKESRLQLISGLPPVRPLRDSGDEKYGVVSLWVIQVLDFTTQPELESLLDLVEENKMATIFLMTGVVLPETLEILERRRKKRPGPPLFAVTDSHTPLRLRLTDTTGAPNHQLPLVAAAIPSDKHILANGGSSSPDAQPADSLTEELIRQRSLVPYGWFTPSQDFSMVPDQLKHFAIDPARDLLLVLPRGLASTNPIGRYGFYTTVWVPPRKVLKISWSGNSAVPLTRRLRIEIADIKLAK